VRRLVVLVDASGGVDARSGNQVVGNVFDGNQTDVFADGTGSGNVISGNACGQGTPPDVCA
jgi:hypothetical protein